MGIESLPLLASLDAHVAAVDLPRLNHVNELRFLERSLVLPGAIQIPTHISSACSCSGASGNGAPQLMPDSASRATVLKSAAPLKLSDTARAIRPEGTLEAHCSRTTITHDRAGFRVRARGIRRRP